MKGREIKKKKKTGGAHKFGWRLVGVTAPRNQFEYSIKIIVTQKLNLFLVSSFPSDEIIDIIRGRRLSGVQLKMVNPLTSSGGSGSASEIKPPHGAHWKCTVCNCLFNTQNDVNGHVKSDKHRLKAKKSRKNKYPISTILPYLSAEKVTRGSLSQTTAKYTAFTTAEEWAEATRAEPDAPLVFFDEFVE